MTDSWKIAKGILIALVIVLLVQFAYRSGNNVTKCSEGDNAACERHTNFIP